jgi:hypothetical protein
LLENPDEQRLVLVGRYSPHTSTSGLVVPDQARTSAGSLGKLLVTSIPFRGSTSCQSFIEQSKIGKSDAVSFITYLVKNKSDFVERKYTGLVDIRLSPQVAC